MNKRLQAQAEHLELDASAQESIRQVREALEVVTNQLNEALKNEHYWRSQAQANEARIEALVNSTSWRITQPLRRLKFLFGLGARLPGRIAKRILGSLLVRLLRFVLSHPRLRLGISNRIKSCSRLLGPVRQFARRHGLLQPDVGTANRVLEHGVNDTDTSFMSPRVARIYGELKLAFENKENC
jgi:hypothetical protein